MSDSLFLEPYDVHIAVHGGTEKITMRTDNYMQAARGEADLWLIKHPAGSWRILNREGAVVESRGTIHPEYETYPELALHLATADTHDMDPDTVAVMWSLDELRSHHAILHEEVA
jgi:hypothetical protein